MVNPEGVGVNRIVKKWLTEGGFAAVDGEASVARSAGRKCAIEAFFLR
jgi:hypothetical protein